MGQNIQRLNGGFMPEGETQNCKLQVLFYVWPTTVSSPQIWEAAQKVVKKTKLSKLLRLSDRNEKKKSVKEVSSEDSKKYLV